MQGSQASPILWYHYCMRLSRQRALRLCALGGVALAAVLVIVPSTRSALHDAAYRMGIHRPIAIVRPVQEGESLPALQLANLRGESVTLPVDPASTVVYNVFASWCGPCNQEAPALAAAAAALQRRGVHFIGIDQGEGASQALAYQRRYGLTYQLLVDPELATRDALGAHVIPETLIVRGGIVQQIVVGPMGEQALIAAVEGA